MLKNYRDKETIHNSNKYYLINKINHVDKKKQIEEDKQCLYYKKFFIPNNYIKQNDSLRMGIYSKVTICNEVDSDESDAESVTW